MANLCIRLTAAESYGRGAISAGAGRPPVGIVSEGRHSGSQDMAVLSVIVNPIGRPRVSKDKENSAEKMLGNGTGILKIAKTLGLGTGTVSRIATKIKSPIGNDKSDTGAMAQMPGNGASKELTETKLS
jgi:hypothetical protein